MRSSTSLAAGTLLILLGVVESITHPFMYGSMEPEKAYPVHELMLNETHADPDGKPDDWHLPNFLLSNHTKHRVVEFYAPFCPHCQHFKDQYIRFARETAALAKKLGSQVDVYAVSCQMHHSICQHVQVGSYPWIVVYPAGSANGTRVQHHDLHPYGVVELLGVELESLTPEEKELSSKLTEVQPQKPNGIGRQASRTKSELYADAFLSFDFAMRQEVYMEPGPLRIRQRYNFQEWIDLLHATLPRAWTNIRKQITAIRDHKDDAIKNETALLALIDPHKPSYDEWSFACSKGVDGMGYSCGLWELFHIMTLGVVEWNKMANEWQVINTNGAADAVRNYVQNFFGCEVCSRNFIMAYDACAFDRCNRLTRYSGKLSDWKELPLWLWETHNAVNVRLMKERAQREGRTTTRQDEIDVQWPSRKECPRCWLPDGSWHEEFIYRYLRLEYWPDDENSEATRKFLSTTKSILDDDEVVVDEKMQEEDKIPVELPGDEAITEPETSLQTKRKLLKHLKTEERIPRLTTHVLDEESPIENMEVPEAPPSPAFALLAFGSIAAAIYVGYAKQLERDRSGRHKKFESDLIV